MLAVLNLPGRAVLRTVATPADMGQFRIFADGDPPPYYFPVFVHPVARKNFKRLRRQAGIPCNIQHKKHVYCGNIKTHENCYPRRGERALRKIRPWHRLLSLLLPLVTPGTRNLWRETVARNWIRIRIRISPMRNKRSYLLIPPSHLRWLTRQL